MTYHLVYTALCTRMLPEDRCSREKGLVRGQGRGRSSVWTVSSSTGKPSKRSWGPGSTPSRTCRASTCRRRTRNSGIRGKWSTSTRTPGKRPARRSTGSCCRRSTRTGRPPERSTPQLLKQVKNRFLQYIRTGWKIGGGGLKKKKAK